jgi:hypothetical protein
MMIEKYNQLFFKDNLYLVGSASSALFIYIKHKGIGKKKVLCPSNICYSIPFTIQSSGNYPLFYDVDEKSGNASYESIRAIIEQSVDIAAIVIPHMYGNVVCQRDMIARLCIQNGILVIDDCAASLGIEDISGGLKNLSDAILFSFGKNKHIDIGGGGGLATDEYINIEYYENNIVNDRNIASAKISIFDQIFKVILYSDYYYNLLPSLTNYSDFIESQFINKVCWTGEMENALQEELSKLGTLKNRALLLTDELQKNIKYGKYFDKYEFSQGSHPWRFNILCLSEKVREDIVDMMLEKKLKVSVWYPPIDSLFNQNIKQNSKVFSQRVMNFNFMSATKQDISDFVNILNLYKGPK